MLALQGGFSEHIVSLRKCGGAEVCEVRTAEELSQVDALVIPGGESTTLGLIATRQGLVEPLRAFVAAKPTWGTCAGLIFLADSVSSQMKTGQTMIGGVAVNAERNAFGRQVESYETQLDLYDIQEEPALRYTNEVPMVFIRAPCITKVLSDKCKVTPPLAQPSVCPVLRQRHLLTHWGARLSSYIRRCHKRYEAACSTALRLYTQAKHTAHVHARHTA